MTLDLDLLNLTLKSSLLLALLGLSCAALHRASASTRHLLWTLGMAGVLLMTVLAAGLPAWHVVPLAGLPPAIAPPASRATVPQPGSGLEPEAGPRGTAVVPAPTRAPSPNGTVPNGPGLSLPAAARLAREFGNAAWRVSGLLWLGGCGLVIAGLAVGLFRVFRLVRNASPLRDPGLIEQCHVLARSLGIQRPVRLCRTDSAVTPMTWGVRRALILLPRGIESWTLDKRRDVLLHELAHVKRRDCLTQWLAHIVCAIYWFNPLAWVAARRMRAEGERACDDQVLIAGTKPSAYASNLLEVACSLRTAPATTMAHRPQISERVAAVLDPARRRGIPGLGTSTAAVAFVAVLVLPLVALGFAGPGIPAAVRQNASLPEETLTAATLRSRAAIEVAGRELAAAVARGDAPAIASWYSEDARVYMPLWGEFRGRSAIERHWRDVFDAGIRDCTFQTLEVQGTGEAAYEIGQYLLREASGRVVARGKYMSLWKHENDVWLIHRDIASM